MLQFLFLAGAVLADLDTQWIVLLDPAISDDVYSDQITLAGALNMNVYREFNFGSFRAYALDGVDEEGMLDHLKEQESVISVEKNQLYSGIPVPEPRFVPKKKVEVDAAGEPLHRRLLWEPTEYVRQTASDGTYYWEEVKKKKDKAVCSVQNAATWGIVRTCQSVNPSDSGSSGEYTYQLDGKGVTAYIVDTGVYMEHEEFEGRVTWLADTAEDPSPKTDTNGHGTHVAGTILSKEYGIAKKAVGKAVRVLGTNGFGTTVGVIEGVEATVTDHQKNRKKRYLSAVANMSLGGGYSAALNGAVKAAIDAGIVYVVAAGNESSDACFGSPSSEKTAITVACSDNDDDICYFSNYGNCVDIFAPGYGITSSWIGDSLAQETISGTSMSSPHVAGVVAKLLSSKQYSSMEQLIKRLDELSTEDIVNLEVAEVRDSTVNKLLFMDCSSE